MSETDLPNDLDANIKAELQRLWDIPDEDWDDVISESYETIVRILGKKRLDAYLSEMFPDLEKAES